jgi:uncharacterized RDD family membrane protein YckC
VKRFVAFFIDINICLSPYYVWSVLFASKDLVDEEYYIKGIVFFFVTIIHFLYHSIQEFFWKASIGKRLFELKVVKIDGSQLNKSDIVKRHILDFIEFYLIMVIPMLMVLIDKRHQRIGDKLANTRVIESL